MLDDLPDPCLLMNGDVLTTIDIAAMVRVHHERRAVMTVATQPREVRIDYGVLETDREGNIAGYREKPVLRYVVSAGVNLIGAEARHTLQRGEPCDIPTLVSGLIEKGARVATYSSSAYWRDIGRPDDYEAANAEFPALMAEFGL